MNKSQKSTFAGILLATGVLVFVPSVYVGIANKLGKLAAIQPAGGTV